jgi:hypothetical protein
LEEYLELLKLILPAVLINHFTDQAAKNGQSEPLKTDFFEPLKKSFQTML